MNPGCYSEATQVSNRLVKLRGKTQQQFFYTWGGLQPGLRNARRRMQCWMVVHLCDQCIHFQLLCSCSSPGKQTTASKAKAVCSCDSIWAREEYAMETGEVWGRLEEVREKRSSMKEVHWNWRCWGENRWQMLSQVFTALLLLGNILTAERVKLWNGSCSGWLCFWFVSAIFLASLGLTN